MTLSTLALLVISSAATARDTYKDKCSDIKACVNYVSKLTGTNYTYEGDVKGKLEATADLEITPQNAELLLTQMLDANGYTRVPLATPKTFTIMRQRDAKDSNLPKVTANSRFEPVLPNTHDWYDMEYTAANDGVAAEMARASRNFMPPNTRIVAFDLSNKVVVTGPIPVLRRIYGLIKDMDRPVSKALRRKWEERDKRLQQRQAPAKSS